MKERIQGCLLGAAIGDALGMPVKGLTGKEISERHGVVRDMLGVPDLYLEPGQYLDDGHLMALTLESICTQRSLSLPDMLRRLKGWFHTHPPDMTPLTRHVLERLDRGEQWEEASEGASFDSDFDPPDGGNLPRCLPVGLYHALRPEKLIADTIAVSRLTHWDDRAVHAAVTLNHLVAELVQGRKGLDTLPGYVADKHPAVAETVRTSATTTGADLDESGSALGALGIGLWAVRTAPSFAEGLSEVVALGGATDLNASVAGALLGAKFGRPAIPERWLTPLEGKVRIEVLATRLYEHATV